MAFAIQLDESTNTSNLGQPPMYHAHEDLLFCQPLEGRTTGEDIFAKLNEFLTANEVSQNKCVGACMGDAAEMTDRPNKKSE